VWKSVKAVMRGGAQRPTYYACLKTTECARTEGERYGRQHHRLHTIGIRLDVVSRPISTALPFQGTCDRCGLGCLKCQSATLSSVVYATKGDLAAVPDNC